MADLLITTVEGWHPDTRLYRLDDGTHWLISIIDVRQGIDMIAQQWGVELAKAEQGDQQAGHCEIYAAAVDLTPIYQWVPDREVADPPPQDECDHSEDGDTLTITHHGDTVCILTRTHIRDDMHIVPIDADGDPLNGLTPRWVLPAGTTFHDALTHILTNTPTPD